MFNKYPYKDEPYWLRKLVFGMLEAVNNAMDDGMPTIYARQVIVDIANMHTEICKMLEDEHKEENEEK